MTLDADRSLALRRPHLLSAARTLKVSVHPPLIASLLKGLAFCELVFKGEISIVLRFSLVQISGKSSEISIDEQEKAKIIGDGIDDGDSVKKHRKQHQQNGRDQQELSELIYASPALHKTIYLVFPSVHRFSSDPFIFYFTPYLYGFHFRYVKKM